MKKLADVAGTSYTWTKAKSGTKYTFTVQAYVGSASGSYDAAGKSVTYMAAPTVKVAQTDGGVSVTWNAVKGSARYMVYYKENGSGWQKIGDTAKTSYTSGPSKLQDGAVYQFAVRCCAADGKTLLSGYTASNKVTYKK